MGRGEPKALPIGFGLQEYRIDAILGRGGFAITYLALDENLSQRVAVKEYLPVQFAARDDGTTVRAASSDQEEIFKWGLDRFLLEAQTVARFRHRSIIGVRRFFRAHGTGYLVMDYEEGDELERLLTRDGAPSEDRLRGWIGLILDGLEKIHAGGVLHRDIKPSNVYVRVDGTPVLLDFGAARQAFNERTHAMTNILTPGYAPLEQYDSSSEQGPWTDIYAVGATAYKAITGNRPVEAPGRFLEDRLVPLAQIAGDRYSEAFLRAIDAALQVDPRRRPQSVADWRPLFEAGGSHSLAFTLPHEAVPARPPVPVSVWRLRPLRWGAASLAVLVVGVLAYEAIRNQAPDLPSAVTPGANQTVSVPLDPLHAKAQALESQGKLFEPPEDNAVAAYRRLAERGDVAGWSGLMRISRLYRDRARAEIRRGEGFGAVESLMLARMAVEIPDGSSFAGVDRNELTAKQAAISVQLSQLATETPSKRVGRLDAKVVDLRLFGKGAENYPKAGAAAYRSRFQVPTARYICYEVVYVHPPVEKMDEIVFAAVLYKDGSAYSTSDRLRARANSGAEKSWFQSCMGSGVPGSWTPGEYRFDVYADGEKIASRSFKITSR